MAVKSTPKPAKSKKRRIGCNTYMAGLFVVFIVAVGIIVWVKAH